MGKYKEISIEKRSTIIALTHRNYTRIKNGIDKTILKLILKCWYLNYWVFVFLKIR